MAAHDGYVTVDDRVRLFFQKIGDGSRTLFVLNGFYLFDDFKYLAEDRTVIFLDLRNRGRSDYLTDSSKLERGVLNDIDDIEAVRRHFGVDQIELLAHSYAGKTVILYAVAHPARVSRVVMIGAMKPDESREYPADLTYSDAILPEFFDKVSQLMPERASLSPQEFCEKFWALLRPIYVANPAHVDRIRWAPCDLPTESNLMSYLNQHLLPSIQRASLTARDLEVVTAPVLVVHGMKDRSSPYGAARDWAMMLPNARLLAVENAAHVPWIEVPESVLEPIQTFLNGAWPSAAQRVESL